MIRSWCERSMSGCSVAAQPGLKPTPYANMNISECKKLHARFPRIPIVVALWDAQGDMEKASDRLTSVGASAVVRNTAQAVEEIARLRQPLIQGVQADEQVATALEA